jgi:hypothetical protein
VYNKRSHSSICTSSKSTAAPFPVALCLCCKQQPRDHIPNENNPLFFGQGSRMRASSSSRSRTRQNNPLNRVYPDIPRHFIDISNGVPGLSERMHRSKQTTMAVKTIVVFLVGLVLASGCVAASGASRYRPCHELRTDMGVSNEEFSRRCRTGFSD